MYAILAADLTKLLKNDEPYEWEEKQQLAFETLKAKLTTAPVLRSPDWNRPFHVYVDTSAFAIGVVLSQKDDNKKDYPIYFASRHLSAAKRKYTTTKREALGMVYSCKKFRHYLICYEFVFHVDHYALQHLVKEADLCGRIDRWVLLLQEFTFTVQTKKGVHHENADYLSGLWTQPTKEEVVDDFPDEQLFQLSASHESRYVKLYRCLEISEVPLVISAMHTEDAGGHYATRNMVTKIVDDNIGDRGDRGSDSSFSD
ncbi:hypothetical protein AXG93_3224s1000 [Marchantia polymorpha subsp. ruderalis]|uniref:Reverse transcriptase/retrotransposon-derived protein RNase H-like domain-containing protein n=1 Tax=Marchantia polymorpha subsp. ruderalis TaxID=1480154 RepID=A0A176VQJ1_MARPO|nr:hypothetical protein AXG93_3224s1000 [Marchantia polymorpha subsp. ruderalis]